MLFLKQPLILLFPCNESATICQTDSYKVSNSKLKSGVCNCAKAEIMESTAPPQQRHKRGAVFFGTPCRMFLKLTVFRHCHSEASKTGACSKLALPLVRHCSYGLDNEALNFM